MSTTDDARAYADALAAIGQARRGAQRDEKRAADRSARRLEQAKTEYREVQRKRGVLDGLVDDLRHRVATAQPERLDRVGGSTDFQVADGSLDDLVRTAHRIDIRLGQTMHQLGAAYRLRATRRRMLLGGALVVAGAVIVLLAGGTLLPAGVCAASVLGVLGWLRVDHNGWAVLPAVVAIVPFGVIAYVGWPWWLSIIGLLLVAIATGWIWQAIDNARSVDSMGR